MFNRNRLSAAIVTVLASAAGSSQVFAQDAQPVEEVIVTGIRASLERAMDIKRDSAGVVDAISAEDIGKFPDTNLAESLQRIPGVSIDRSNGEGSKVTVRGFGAERNLITLNGRVLPTTTGDRSFEFANVASEAVSAVEVYKTADARVTSGGIGATINLVTHRPLKNPGLKATAGAKLVMDDSTDEGDVTPEISGLYSNTFMDDKFGISIVASYQERESGLREFLQDQGYRAQEASFTGWGGAPARPEGGANRPEEGIYSVPQQPRYIFEERQRERTNGQLVLQYEPTDDVTLTADYTLINNTYETQHTDVSAWFNYAGDRSSSVWAGAPNAYPLWYAEVEPDESRDTSMTFGSYGNEEEIESTGFNVEWRATDQLTMEFDYHTSEGNRKATDPRRGTRNNLQVPSYTRNRTGMSLAGDLPGIAIGADNLEDFTPATFRLSGSWFQNHRYTSESEQAQVKGTFEFDEEMSVDFGLSLDTISNHLRFVSVERPDWAGVGPESGAFSDIDWEERSVIDKFQASPAVPGGVSFDGWAWLDRAWFADFDQIVAAAEQADPAFNTTSNIEGDCEPAEGAPAGPDGGGQFCISSDFGLGRNEFTEEETTSLYARWNKEGEVGGYPYDVHVGLRYEQTDIYSYASTPTYSSVVWTEATQAALNGDGSFVILDQSDDYSQFLPSINANISPSDDFKIRAAIGKTISRPAYTDLLGGVNISGAGNRSGFSGSTGNVSLDPLESFNIDLSVEWYYNDTSYASVGAFRKEAKNWTSTTTEESQVFDPPLPNVFSGEMFDAAIENLGAGASNEDIRAYIFANYADRPYVEPLEGGDPDQGTITGTLEVNDPIVFDIRSPVNSDEKRTIMGLEFNIQHLFGDTGFGVVANYTIADGDISYDDESLSDTPALPGLSDTANLVLFYDNYGLQTRLAYNWRDDFLNERRVNADLTAGIYTAAYSQIDLNVSYDLPMLDGMTVFFEGINLTDEYVETYGRARALVYRITETGPRYNLGVRYTF